MHGRAESHMLDWAPSCTGALCFVCVGSSEWGVDLVMYFCLKRLIFVCRLIYKQDD